MSAHTPMPHQPVVLTLEEFDSQSGNWVERALFNHRRTVLLVCLLCTLVLGFFATRIHLNASFEKMIPTGHPYIANFLENRRRCAG